MLAHAYLWIPVGWVVQIHALYLQLAGAPRTWHVTPKRGRATGGGGTPTERGTGRPSRPPAGETTLREARPDEVPWTRARFETYAVRSGEERFLLRHEDGDVIANGGEGYASRGAVLRAIASLREVAGAAAYVRCDPAGTEVYRDDAGGWRWRLVGPDDRALAASATAFGARAGAARSADRVRASLAVDGVKPAVTRDGDGYRWHFRSENGLAAARSVRRFSTERGARESFARTREYAPLADHLDIGRGAFEFRVDSDGEHRWRLRHRNGAVLLDSAGEYDTRREARDAVERVRRYAPAAPVEAVEGAATPTADGEREPAAVPVE
jgi:uncharacterized protein YegP (UPF0339 family)